MSLAAVILQKIQDAVPQACGGRHQEEQEQETDRANTFLQTAAEKHQGCEVQEELSPGPVVKRVQNKSVEVSTLENRGTDAEDPRGEVEVCLEAKQNTRPKNHSENPAGDNGSGVSENLQHYFKVIL